MAGSVPVMMTGCAKGARMRNKGEERFERKERRAHSGWSGQGERRYDTASGKWQVVMLVLAFVMWEEKRHEAEKKNEESAQGGRGKGGRGEGRGSDVLRRDDRSQGEKR